MSIPAVPPPIVRVEGAVHMSAIETRGLARYSRLRLPVGPNPLSPDMLA